MKGRETLVPGFMAGLESMHRRFGQTPFNKLFQPAIWYAEKGVRISPALQYYFSVREKLFCEHRRAVIFCVNEPIWSEPRHETVFGHTIYANGAPHIGAHSLFVGLNLAEALNLDRGNPYWVDPGTFRTLARIGLIADVAPLIGKRTADLLLAEGVDISAEFQLGKSYARALGPMVDGIFTSPADNHPKHSNAIVVVDRSGNIAVVTHTINSVIWDDTGIVVDGVPIPDSAGFQQTALAKIKPGDRLPHRIIDAIAFKDDAPVLAIGSIGSSLVRESIRVLLGVLGQDQDLATLMRAPPLLSNPGSSVIIRSAWQIPVAIPADVYAPDFVAKLKTSGLVLEEVPAVKTAGIRGTLAAVSIDPETGKRTAADQPGLFIFNHAE